ncbi:MAG: ABC transporter ATP-binding protein [Actinobacteria bacterium]|nr:ABC transporter ATP-binding protein [Actinomycetota bacterium]
MSARERVRVLYGDSLTRHPALRPPPTRRVPLTSLLRFTPYIRPYRGRFLVMFLAALGGTGISIVIPLVTRQLIDGPIAAGDRQGVFALGAVALALGLVEGGLAFLRRWVMAIATLGSETGVRLDMYAKLQRLPWGFHARWESGQLLSRIMNDLSTMRRFIGFGLLMIVMNLLQIVVVTSLLLRLYWPMGLVVGVAAVPVVLVCLVNERVYTRLSRGIQDQTGDVASSVEEAMQSVRVIKAFGRAGLVYDQFDRRARVLYATSMERVSNTSKFWTFLEVIPGLALVAVLTIGALAAAQHHLTLGTLVAFITMMLSLIWPVAALGFLLSMTQDAMTAADRVTEIFDAPESIADGPLHLEQPQGEVVFDNVSYRFPDSEEDVLHGLNLHVRAGETIGIVGGTGSGKTVLTSLVARLVDVTQGRITIDDVDIRDLKVANLRGIVATAFEDPTLFSMSVRENLTLGRPDATEEEVADALETAQAGFVHELPWGLDTRIGEQGMSLSGGQRQRLALARAILVKPRVLVLDDTLSALDIHTEALVEEALKRVLVGVTGLVVAHRASTVMLADRVALLQNGTITHIGTHSELLATVPEYRDLLSASFDAESELDELEREVAQ